MKDKERRDQDERMKPRTNEEQMLNRQSAPMPSAEDYLNQVMSDGMVQSSDGTSANGYSVLDAPIGREAISKATQTLQKYKEGKANLERRIIENEQWYKLRHWECMKNKSQDAIKPTSAWLFNCLANKHADAMDNYPSPNILPREEADKGEAEMLSSILPVILEQNDFEDTYSKCWTKKVQSGTGVYGVFWDATKLNGLGDISIVPIDLLDLYWESGVQDVQKSRNLFQVTLMDNDVLESRYPQLHGKLGSPTINVATYIYDDAVPTDNKSVVVDWYYKKYQNGRTVLHYCKYCNDEVLFATENDPRYKESGWFEHGLYPYIFDVLFSVEGTPAGFGYVDIGKNCQEYIDRGNQAIMENMLENAVPRHFVRNDGSINEEEYADLSKRIIHVDGNLGEDSIREVRVSPISSIYVEILNEKKDELKETTGNRDISNGGTSAGVTAASAIAAMQEAGSKLSRDANKTSYRAFRHICEMCIELIRQYYTLPRCFRIIGANGAMRFVSYSNEHIVPQVQGIDFGMDMGIRLPVFDVEITAQKQSPYSKMAQNELALQFYGAGFFNPAMSQQALACLDMMDFDRKNFVMQKIAENGMMYMQSQMMMMQAQNVDASEDDQDGNRRPGKIDDGKADESSTTQKARQRVAESTAPR